MSAHVESGYGPCIVFLAPLGGSHQMFTRQLEEFARDHRTVAVTLRGNHGAESLRGVPVDQVIQTQADDVVALLRRLEIPRAHLVGVGLGGAVAQRIALQQPELLRSLVLSDTWASLRPRTPADRLIRTAQRSSAWAYLLPKALVRGVTLNNYARWPQAGHEVAEELIRCDREELSLQQRAWTSVDHEIALHRLDKPTLCLAGDAARYLVTLGRRMAQTIPDARFVELANCLEPSPLCQPEAFNTELRRFITELPTGW